MVNTVNKFILPIILALFASALQSKNDCKKKVYVSFYTLAVCILHFYKIWYKKFFQCLRLSPKCNVLSSLRIAIRSATLLLFLQLLYILLSLQLNTCCLTPTLRSAASITNFQDIFI